MSQRDTLLEHAPSVQHLKDLAKALADEAECAAAAVKRGDRLTLPRRVRDQKKACLTYSQPWPFGDARSALITFEAVAKVVCHMLKPLLGGRTFHKWS